jgi:hypothetical protein
MLLSQKFRAERNFWISLSTLFAWAMFILTHKVGAGAGMLWGRGPT